MVELCALWLPWSVETTEFGKASLQFWVKDEDPPMVSFNLIYLFLTRWQWGLGFQHISLGGTHLSDPENMPTKGEDAWMALEDKHGVILPWTRQLGSLELERARTSVVWSLWGEMRLLLMDGVLDYWRINDSVAWTAQCLIICYGTLWNSPKGYLQVYTSPD